MLPLTGITVLDLADEPVVLAARLLADLGADVIRMEALEGDRLRNRPPFLAEQVSVERSLAHLLYNAGKRSVALALHSEESWGIVEAALPRVDVVILPLEQSALVRSTFAHDRLMTISPTVGVVETVFVRDGTDVAISDLIGTAAGGLLYLNGYAEDPPNVPAGKLAYKQTALAAALGAVSLVLARGDGSSPGRITVSMQEAVTWTTIQSANENYWHWHQASPSRRGIDNLGGRTIFEAADGEWVSFYHHPPSWPNFLDWLTDAFGAHEFCGDDWAEGLFRFQHLVEITAATARLCQTLPRAALVEEGQRRGMLVVPVQGVADIASDQHLRDRGFFQQVEHKQFDAAIEVARPPFISSAYETVARRAPSLGEHTREVLTDLCGFDAETIDGYVSRGLAFEGVRQ